MSQDHSIDPALWVDSHGDALYAYAILRIRDAEAAADLVQETFLEALKSRERFEGRSSERTWLVGILKHKIIDRFRSKAHRQQTLGEGDQHELDLSEFFDDRGGWKGRCELPELVVERAEFWEIFQACLAELPTNYSEAFTLCELEGLPGPEVSQILQITQSNLWARLHRARLLLRRSLEARWFGADKGSD